MIKNHPIYYLRQNLLKKEPRIILEFSRYVYVSYGVTESREIFYIKAKDLIDGWLEDQILYLSGGQELALHSRVRINEDDKNIYHIPMIDFINSKSGDKIISKLSNVNSMLNSKLTMYESGNSFHGYYFELINEQKWNKFLGQILLCNPPSRYNDEVVDSRWVGHSLINGFSALRWSKKTEKYKLIPTLHNKRENNKTTKLSGKLVFE